MPERTVEMAWASSKNEFDQPSSSAGRLYSANRVGHIEAPVGQLHLRAPRVAFAVQNQSQTKI